MTLTLKNSSHIQQVLEQAARGLPITNTLKKVGKAAMLAMAESAIHSVTNTELLALNQRKKTKAERPTASYGAARVINHDVINERKAFAAERLFDREWAGLLRIPLNVLQPKRLITSTPRRQSLHQTNKAFEEEWTHLRRLPEDLFTVKKTAVAKKTAVRKKVTFKKTTQEQPPLLDQLSPKRFSTRGRLLRSSKASKASKSSS